MNCCACNRAIEDGEGSKRIEIEDGGLDDVVGNFVVGACCWWWWRDVGFLAALDGTAISPPPVADD